MVRNVVLVKTLQRYYTVEAAGTLPSWRLTLTPSAPVVARFVRRVIVDGQGWHFPGGGLEKGETVATALVRELQEEAGIALSVPPQLFGVYANFRNFPGDHIVLFVARKWRQDRVPPPNAEIREQGFFAADALPQGATDASRRRIAEVLDGVSRSETW